MDKAHHMPSWMKLDNAAKIYPAAMSRQWTAMFRLSMNLQDDVDPDLLQQAVDRTLPRFPAFSGRLRSGLFWYYMEPIGRRLQVQPDVGNPLVRMNLKENNGFMLRVRYYGRRIAVEYFHVLTDGTGGLCFLKTLVAEYLTLRYGAEIPRAGDILDVTQPPNPAELEDSFMRYARSVGRSRRELPAYFVPGTEEQHLLHITTGFLDADAVLALARQHSCTLTELLASVLILAIDDIQSRVRPQRRRKAIKVCVPINLRKYYGAGTLRNFSSFVNPGIEPKYGQYNLAETIRLVRAFMQRESDEKLLNARFSSNVHSERNLVLRLMPLVIKSAAMKMIFLSKGDKQSSSTLTNLGNLSLPPEMARYVQRADLLLGPLKRNRVAAAVLSYEGELVVTFTRKIMESQVERNFFTRLRKLGLHVKIESNQGY